MSQKVLFISFQASESETYEEEIVNEYLEQGYYVKQIHNVTPPIANLPHIEDPMRFVPTRLIIVLEKV